MGIHISKRAYNQLELFVSSFPGNCYSLNEEYDRFLTLDVYKRQPLARYITEGILPLSNFIITHLCKIID